MIGIRVILISILKTLFKEPIKKNYEKYMNYEMNQLHSTPALYV